MALALGPALLQRVRRPMGSPISEHLSRELPLGRGQDGNLDRSARFVRNYTGLFQFKETYGLDSGQRGDYSQLRQLSQLRDPPRVRQAVKRR